MLVDADGKHPDTGLAPFQDLESRLNPQITASVKFAYAQWHLEAWFFSDSENLRAYLGRDLGSVDTSKPDDIENPKQHLKNLLDDNYTRITSQDIARRLNPSRCPQPQLQPVYRGSPQRKRLKPAASPRRAAKGGHRGANHADCRPHHKHVAVRFQERCGLRPRSSGQLEQVVVFAKGENAAENHYGRY